MDKELFDYVAERADILSTAESSKQETKDAALAWKEAVAADAGDAAVAEATAKLVDYLDDRPRTAEQPEGERLQHRCDQLARNARLPEGWCSRGYEPGCRPA